MTDGLVFSSTSALIERRYKALMRFLHMFRVPFPTALEFRPILTRRKAGVKLVLIRPPVVSDY